MSQLSCDDLTCGCCWPDLQCSCTRRWDQDGWQHDDLYVCPDCGATWRAIGRDHLPEHVRERYERSLAKVAEMCARHGRPVPEQSPLTWRRVAPAVRLKGSAP